MATRFHYDFEWDPTKAKQNVKKHRVPFERAATIFLDPNALSEFDSEEGGNEDRWVTMGLDRTGMLLVVCHTYREENKSSARIRLISARKPTKSEARQYERK